MDQKIILFLLFTTIIASYSVRANTVNDLGFFIKTEINDDDYINGIGTELWLTNESSSLGIAINSALGNAAVTDTLNIQHEYLAWDLGIKFGYFSDVFIYAEIGFDFGEMILSDRDKDKYDDELNFSEFLAFIVLDGYSDYRDYNDYYDDYDSSNDIDGYIGSGVGLKFDNIVVEAYARYRQVDGEYWQADSQVYSGVKLTLLF
jgi:hypothetical protein